MQWKIVLYYSYSNTKLPIFVLSNQPDTFVHAYSSMLQVSVVIVKVLYSSQTFSAWGNKCML